MLLVGILEFWKRLEQVTCQLLSLMQKNLYSSFVLERGYFVDHLVQKFSDSLGVGFLNAIDEF